MERTLIVDTIDKIVRDVLVKGWVKTRRDHGKLIFLDIRDRSGLLQVVVNPKVSEDAYKKAQELRPEDAVEITGRVNKRPVGAINKDLLTGEVEVEVKDIKVLVKSDVLPFDMGQECLNLELPTLLDYRSLTLRHPSVAAIFKVQEAIVESFKEAAKKLGCTEIFVPTIAASATEGGAEVFKINYFDYTAFLTQSPQLYKQILVGVFERVYTIAHAYRAEPSVTTKHLTESVQMDCEIAFIDDFSELLDTLEFVGTYVIAKTTNKLCDIINSFEKELPLIPQSIPRLKMREAQEIIYKRTGRDVRKEPDLSSEDEKDIWLWAKEEKKSDFVTVTHYPTSKRAFYTLPDPKDPEYSLSYDLIFRGMEVLSGSQRINNYDQLIDTIKKRGLSAESFGIYLQAFKYGIPPEGGFSFGLERLTMKILNLGNIREASLFPRDLERVDERLSVLFQKDGKYSSTNKSDRKTK